MQKLAVATPDKAQFAAARIANVIYGKQTWLELLAQKRPQELKQAGPKFLAAVKHGGNCSRIGNLKRL
jgi:hypothetical protein